METQVEGRNQLGLVGSFRTMTYRVRAFVVLHGFLFALHLVLHLSHLGELQAEGTFLALIVLGLNYGCMAALLWIAFFRRRWLYAAVFLSWPILVITALATGTFRLFEPDLFFGLFPWMLWCSLLEDAT